MKNNILAIGIDNYQSINKLSNCVKDIENILDILVEKFDFEGENISKLYDQDANQSNIISSLEDLLYRQSKGENLLIFYSGHGEFDENLDLGYFLPFETELDKKHTYIPNTTIFNYIKSLEYRHTLIISDSCFSGSLFESTRLSRDLPEKLYEIPSKWALTSGRLEKVSDGIPGKNSPFANSILKRLKDFKGESLSTSELTNYIISDVAKTNSQLPWGSPLSKYGDKGGQFSFKIKNKHFIKYNSKNDTLTDYNISLFNDYYNYYEKYEDAENKNNKATSRRLIEELDFIKNEIYKEIIKKIEIEKNSNNTTLKLKEILGENFQISYGDYLKIREEKNQAVKKQFYEAAAKLRDEEKTKINKIQKIIKDNKNKLIELLFKKEDLLVTDYSLFLFLFEFIGQKSTESLNKDFLDFYFYKISNDLNKITTFRFNNYKQSFFNKITLILENNLNKSILDNNLNRIKDNEKLMYLSLSEDVEPKYIQKERPRARPTLSRRKN